MLNRITNNTANERVIRSLCGNSSESVSVDDPASFPDPGRPYTSSGCHPEIVERIWDDLGHASTSLIRRLLCGRPVLVDAETGEVLVVGWGTSYAIRVPEDDLPSAEQAGYLASHRWSDGAVTDLSCELGSGWVFGQWATEERAWLRPRDVRPKQLPAERA
jgi:hypothetical protein